MGSFTALYADSMVRRLSMVLGDDPDTGEAIREFVETKMAERLDRKVPVTIHNNYREKLMSTDMGNLLDIVADRKAVVSGYGALFKHTENVPGRILKHLISARKEAKNKMFEHVNDVDRTLHDMYDVMQKVIKVLARSVGPGFGNEI